MWLQREEISTTYSVKQKVWPFDSVLKVFLLSFLGFGFTFHRFLGNQTDIENSRERDHAIISVHCLHCFYFCRNFLFFNNAACHCSLRERERFFFSFLFWERERKIRMLSVLGFSFYFFCVLAKHCNFWNFNCKCGKFLRGFNRLFFCFNHQTGLRL